MLANILIKKYCKDDQSHAEQLNASVSMYSRLSMLVLQPRQAIYLGYMSILGFQIGAKLHRRVCQLLVWAFVIIFVLILVITGVMLLIMKPLCSLFSSNKDFVSSSAKAVSMAIAGYPFGGPLMLCSGLFQMEHKPAIASIF